MQYQLQDKDQRLLAVRDSGTVNAIEYLEVVTEDQRTLRLVFVHPLPGQSGAVPALPVLTPDNIKIDGGVRIKNIVAQSVAITDNILEVQVNQAGDFSHYQLSIVNSVFDDSTPAGFDPVLSSTHLDFKVACPNNLDCAPQKDQSINKIDIPNIDYLAKDYQSFRRLMLERASLVMPQWRERNPADQQIMLTELLAYVGDQLSYFQDAVATESYLGTANQRRSLRRHARILDYHVHEGCNARTWVHLSVQSGSSADGAALPAATPIITADLAQPASISQEKYLQLNSNEIVFETMHTQSLHPAHNQIEFYTWSHSATCLAKGATSAVLSNNPVLKLSEGDVLLLEQIRDPDASQDVEPSTPKKHLLRLINVIPKSDPLNGTQLLEVQWHVQDALPFSLCLEAQTIVEGLTQWVTVSIARANMVLVDHGMTVLGNPGINPDTPNKDERYRPTLDSLGITFREKYNHVNAQDQAVKTTSIQDPRKCLADVILRDGSNIWTVKQDLLNSDRFAQEFVVENEHDGTAHLRFGDNVHGQKPEPGDVFQAVYRYGTGVAGNIGASSLRQVVSNFSGFLRVYNPLAVSGGKDAESAEAIRRYAPQAFRKQERAVTEADWAEVAERHPEIQKARAEFRWTGSWYTVFITIDRLGGRPVVSDKKFSDEMLAFLNRYRIAGYDLKLQEPLMVSLDIHLRVCIQSNYSASDIFQELLSKFSSVTLNNEENGFFHPDEFSFGQTLYLSNIYQRAMTIEGVCSVQALKFQRWGKTDQGEINQGFIKPSAKEILRCASDPSLPEHGSIRFEVLSTS